MIDLEAALERCGGDRDLLREIGEIFIETLPAMQAQLRDALQRGDSSEVRRLVHTLKNSADNIGALAIRDDARAIEEAIATHGFDPELTPQCDQLLIRFDALATEVRDQIVNERLD